MPAGWKCRENNMRLSRVRVTMHCPRCGWARVFPAPLSRSGERRSAADEVSPEDTLVPREPSHQDANRPPTKQARDGVWSPQF